MRNAGSSAVIERAENSKASRQLPRQRGPLMTMASPA